MINVIRYDKHNTYLNGEIVEYRASIIQFQWFYYLILHFYVQLLYTSAYVSIFSLVLLYITEIIWPKIQEYVISMIIESRTSDEHWLFDFESHQSPE